jgi:hypothetical protein
MFEGFEDAQYVQNTANDRNRPARLWNFLLQEELDDYILKYSIRCAACELEEICRDPLGFFLLLDFLSPSMREDEIQSDEQARHFAHFLAGAATYRMHGGTAHPELAERLIRDFISENATGSQRFASSATTMSVRLKPKTASLQQASKKPVEEQQAAAVRASTAEGCTTLPTEYEQSKLCPLRRVLEGASSDPARRGSVLQAGRRRLLAAPPLGLGVGTGEGAECKKGEDEPEGLLHLPRPLIDKVLNRHLIAKKALSKTALRPEPEPSCGATRAAAPCDAAEIVSKVVATSRMNVEESFLQASTAVTAVGLLTAVTAADQKVSSSIGEVSAVTASPSNATLKGPVTGLGGSAGNGSQVNQEKKSDECTQTQWPLNLFDEVDEYVFAKLEVEYFPRFKQSPQWAYYFQFTHIREKPINDADFELFRVLGRGGFGMVNGCKRKDSGKMFAMKTMSKARVKSKRAQALCLNERRVLKTVRGSEFLVSLAYAYTTPGDLVLILDLMTGGDLSYHLGKKGRFESSHARYYAARTVLGLADLHVHGIVYRDLKVSLPAFLLVRLSICLSVCLSILFFPFMCLSMNTYLCLCACGRPPPLPQTPPPVHHN